MFAVIRHYHFNPKDGAEIDRRIREEFVPIVKTAKGFVRYYWLDTGDREGASLSVFKDKALRNSAKPSGARVAWTPIAHSTTTNFPLAPFDSITRCASWTSSKRNTRVGFAL